MSRGIQLTVEKPYSSFTKTTTGSTGERHRRMQGEQLPVAGSVPNPAGPVKGA